MLRTGSPLGSRQLECFIAVAEERNLTRAAARLHMAQPPLTRRIRTLERDVGVELFRRIAGGVELTEAGEALLTRAYRIVALSTYAVDQARSASAGERGELVCGYSDPSILDSIPTLLADFAAEHPGISIRLKYVMDEDQIVLIHDDMVQVAFGRCYEFEAEMACRSVASEEIYLAVQDVHPLAQKSSAELADLRGLPLTLFPPLRSGFSDRLIGMCMNAGFTPTLDPEADRVVSALAYVAMGSTATVVPRSATKLSPPGVTFLPLVDAAPEELNCIHLRHIVSPALQLFVRWLDANEAAPLDVAARLPLMRNSAKPPQPQMI